MIGKPSFEEVPFKYNTFGKPLLDNIQFNSSSSNDIIAIVIAPSQSPIGIDLSHSRQDSISETDYLTQFAPIFTENEIAQIDSYFKFNHFWTLKEAFTKLLGCGLNIDLASFEFIVSDGFNEDVYNASVENNEIKWFDEIRINTDKLVDNNVYQQLPSHDFYCYSSILQKRTRDELPVIVSIITLEKVEEVANYTDFEETLYKCIP
ncbi:unnamed protein product [Candida verbasci]|uniref:holo-[acyl-carrier-protein] synthase n=1 Tax=Candida verbasci TaxID=1227364 RepID=A0A9W4TQW0_9ASCO|nr:unnamed protein product [Candida verbasci]